MVNLTLANNNITRFIQALKLAGYGLANTMPRHDEISHKFRTKHKKHVTARILTGICLLIEDCSLIIKPVPRKTLKM